MRMFNLKKIVNDIGFNIMFSGMIYFLQSDRVLKISFVFSQYESNIDGYNTKNIFVLLLTFWQVYVPLIGDCTCVQRVEQCIAQQYLDSK